MPPRTPKVRRIIKTFVQFQNGEIEVYESFRRNIAGKEGYKQALLRMMKKEMS